MLVNLFLREVSAWSEPPPRVSVSSESDFAKDIFAELNGNSKENRCWGKGRASFKRLRNSSDPEYSREGVRLNFVKSTTMKNIFKALQA